MVSRMIDALRSLLFNVAYVLGSLIVSLLLLWATFLPVRFCAPIVSEVYGGYMRFITRWIMGLRLKIEGWENVPADGVYILAAKHQSAFETLNLPFMRALRYPVIILKRELTRIPIWGRFFIPMGHVPIDRTAGAEALRAMMDGCRKALSTGRPVIIFPQGTRVRPGEKAAYKPGLAKMYKDLNVPIVPLALNAGVFWGKNAFFKKSGVVTYKFLPPIPAGLPPLKAMQKLEEVLETESDALAREAGF